MALCLYAVSLAACSMGYEKPLPTCCVSDDLTAMCTNYSFTFLNQPLLFFINKLSVFLEVIQSVDTYVIKLGLCKGSLLHKVSSFLGFEPLDGCSLLPHPPLHSLLHRHSKS